MSKIASRTNTMGLTGRRLRWAITATSVIGFSLFGYDQGLMSGIITGVKFNEEFPATAGTSHRATVIQGAVTSCYELGCFFGAVFTLLRGERIGRRPLMLVGAVLMIIGTVISVTPFKGHWALGQFVVGRVISGLGNGMNTATIPVWQSEMSKAKNRGLLVNLEGAVIACGTFVAYWLDFGLSYVPSSVQWRFPIAFQIVFAAMLFVGAFNLPESPRWLIARGRDDEAKHVLFALEGETANKEEIELEARIIRDAIEKTGKQGGLGDLFTNGKTQHFRRMLIGSSTQFFQFTGCNASIYYSTVLFETSLRQSRRLSLVMGGVFATVYVIFTLPSFFLVERVGRRNLFMIGAFGQGCAFIITMACLAAPETVSNAKGAAVGLYLFIAMFAWTILPLPWLYSPEINPLRTRTAAVSVSTCTNWISNFAVVMFTPLFISSTRWGAYLFFALVNFLWIPIIFFFYPETAGRRLEEMDLIFAKAHIEGKPAYRIAKQMPKLQPAEIEQEAAKIGLFEVLEDPEASASTSPGRISDSSAEAEVVDLETLARASVRQIGPADHAVRWVDGLHPLACTIRSLRQSARLPNSIPVFVGAGTLHWIGGGDEAAEKGEKGLVSFPSSFLKDRTFIETDQIKAKAAHGARVKHAKVGPFERAWDWLGDGSLFIASAEGHCPGHQVMLAKTSHDPTPSWVLLSGDAAHQQALYRPLPAPLELGAESLCSTRPHHDAVYRSEDDLRATPGFFDRASADAIVDGPIPAGSAACMQEFPDKAMRTLAALSRLEACHDVMVVLAHELEFTHALELKEGDEVVVHDWRNQGWKEKIEMGKRAREQLASL